MNNYSISNYVASEDAINNFQSIKSALGENLAEVHGRCSSRETPKAHLLYKSLKDYSYPFGTKLKLNKKILGILKEDIGKMTNGSFLLNQKRNETIFHVILQVLEYFIIESEWGVKEIELNQTLLANKLNTTQQSVSRAILWLCENEFIHNTSTAYQKHVKAKPYIGTERIANYFLNNSRQEKEDSIIKIKQTWKPYTELGWKIGSTCYCETCNKDKELIEFGIYKSKHEDYDDYVLDFCKDCVRKSYTNSAFKEQFDEAVDKAKKSKRQGKSRLYEIRYDEANLHFEYKEAIDSLIGITEEELDRLIEGNDYKGGRR